MHVCRWKRTRRRRVGVMGLDPRACNWACVPTSHPLPAYSISLWKRSPLYLHPPLPTRYKLIQNPSEGSPFCSSLLHLVFNRQLAFVMAKGLFSALKGIDAFGKVIPLNSVLSLHWILNIFFRDNVDNRGCQGQDTDGCSL